ncbi:DinB family protein [Vogesella oryzae]|uniref:DinB family protein n=1 Tax=Vogesella oryzae TaxID=1735285 RepID=UPI001582AF9C|nr:DinB family protein [Vogesella oryzae]
MTDTQTLTRYKAWADDLFLSAVATLPEADLLAPQPIVFGSLIRTLNHALAIDYVWQCHLLGTAHGLTSRNPEHCPDIVELVDRQRALNQWYVDYAAALDEAERDEMVSFEFIGGGAGRMRRRDILLHVVNHASYHRGHAAGMLYSLDVFPPTTDLPVFLQQQQPA